MPPLSYATPHPTPHAQRPEKPARFTPGYRFNFDQFWQRYEIDCPTFVQPIEPESPRIHPSRIEIFDRLIFHPDRARRMRAPRFALDRCRQFCCIRWTVSSDREYVYIYIYIFPFFLFSSPFFLPPPLPSREFETRPRETRQRASLFDPREIRWDMEYEGGEEMVGFTADSKDRRVEGDRWWWSMVFFIFIFFPSPGYINKIETNLKLKYIYIYFLYTCVIKFDVTTFLNFIKMYG